MDHKHRQEDDNLGNETEAYLSEISEHPATLELAEQIEGLFCQHYSNGMIMTALLSVLSTHHICMYLMDDGSVCQPCLRIGLTETLQIIRKLVDAGIADVENPLSPHFNGDAQDPIDDDDEDDDDFPPEDYGD